MKLSQLIHDLNDLHTEYGNVDVFVFDGREICRMNVVMVLDNITGRPYACIFSPQPED